MLLLVVITVASISTYASWNVFADRAKDVTALRANWSDTVIAQLARPDKPDYPPNPTLLDIAAKCGDKSGIPKFIETGRYIIDDKQACAGEQVWMLTAIHSKPSDWKNRDAIRGSWASLSRVNGKRIKYLFFFGAVKDKKVQEKLEEESDMYRDVIQRDFVEDYRNMTRKHVTILEWLAMGRCKGVKYLLKVDDDVMLDMHKLVLTLTSEEEFVPARGFFCTGTMNARVIRGNTRSRMMRKWAVTSQEYSKKFYPTYCEGYVYVMAAEIASELYWCSVFNGFLWIDDILITGILAEKLGLPRRAFLPGQQTLRINHNGDSPYMRDGLAHFFFSSRFDAKVWRKLWLNVMRSNTRW